MSATQSSDAARVQMVLAEEPAEPRVDDDTFRAVMGALPTGVTVVTTTDSEGLPRGLTCSAVCSVSKTPPLLLVCLHRSSSVAADLRARGYFVVNILRDNREHVSDLFASPRSDRFAAVSWQPGAVSGTPWLHQDTIAHAECRVAGTIEAGDHTIVVGVLLSGSAEQSRTTPLMYWRRRYAPWPTSHDVEAAAMMLATEG
jgi:flavin reductase (DIM6/NTAB) family NADH-FMN oxidoreductase RutF